MCFVDPKPSEIRLCRSKLHVKKKIVKFSGISLFSIFFMYCTRSVTCTAGKKKRKASLFTLGLARAHILYWYSPKFMNRMILNSFENMRSFAHLNGLAMGNLLICMWVSCSLRESAIRFSVHYSAKFFNGIQHNFCVSFLHFKTLYEAEPAVKVLEISYILHYKKSSL